jgi:hypothetical protein
VSLVKESGLIRGSKIELGSSRIQGITGNSVEIKGQLKLNVGDTFPHEFLIKDNLTMNYDLLLGQDWLEKFGFNFQIASLGITLPPYSETLVRIPTKEKGNRLVEAQVLQENIFCASSGVECGNNSFIYLLINLNSKEQTLEHFPQIQELPKLNSQFQNRKF